MKTQIILNTSIVYDVCNGVWRKKGREIAFEVKWWQFYCKVIQTRAKLFSRLFDKIHKCTINKKKTLLLLKSALKMDLTKEHDRESQRRNTKFKNKSTQTVLSLVVLVVWCWLTTTFFLILLLTILHSNLTADRPTNLEHSTSTLVKAKQIYIY